MSFYLLPSLSGPSKPCFMDFKKNQFCLLTFWNKPSLGASKTHALDLEADLPDCKPRPSMRKLKLQKNQNKTNKNQKPKKPKTKQQQPTNRKKKKTSQKVKFSSEKIKLVLIGARVERVIESRKQPEAPISV